MLGDVAGCYSRMGAPSTALIRAMFRRTYPACTVNQHGPGAARSHVDAQKFHESKGWTFSCPS